MIDGRVGLIVALVPHSELGPAWRTVLEEALTLFNV